MTRRRCLRAALHNYLGTLTSRYSDLDGYWILGLLVDDLETRTVDLMTESSVDNQSKAWATFIRLARDKFHEQIAKQRIATSFVRAAVLEIKKPPTLSEGYVNGHVRAGHDVAFTARVESDLHTVYASEMSVFVAPHNADIESRSRRRGPPAPASPGLAR
jgi:hypothetical protein